MKRFPFILLALATPLAAAEIQSAHIPASANWVLHADMDAMRATQTGRAVLDRIESEHGAKLRAAKRMFSVHLLTDLRDVTLFGDGRKDHAVVLFSGTFDRGHLTDLVKAADDYSESTHAGFTIHTWKDKGTLQHAAFASGDLLVFSNQGGSTAAFGELVHRHHERVFGFLLALTRHRQDAEDLTQETFLRAWDRIHRYDPSLPMLPWLMVIARRQSIAALRRARPITAMPPPLPETHEPSELNFEG